MTPIKASDAGRHPVAPAGPPDGPSNKKRIIRVALIASVAVAVVLS